MPTTQEIPNPSPIGRSTPRVDGPLKVSGVAQYTSDFNFPGQLYAVPVEATIANGRVIELDTAAAEKMPGVRAVFHRENIGKIFRSVLGQGFEGICDERRPPFEDDVVRYYGQYIALAVADTFETAKAAADAVRVTYAREKPNVDTDLKPDDDPEVVATTFSPRERFPRQRGDAQAALHLMFLFAFQDVTWIAVPPHIPGPDALPQTSTAVPGGIHGLAPQREYLPFAVETPRQYGACT